MAVQRSVKVQSESGLTVNDIIEFVGQVPDDVRGEVPTIIMGDKGSQRDPWPFLRGLSIEWSE